MRRRFEMRPEDRRWLTEHGALAAITPAQTPPTTLACAVRAFETWVSLCAPVPPGSMLRVGRGDVAEYVEVEYEVNQFGPWSYDLVRPFTRPHQLGELVEVRPWTTAGLVEAARSGNPWPV